MHTYIHHILQDMAALHAREVMKAKLQKERQVLHKQQLASVPAPFIKSHKVKAGHLTLGDKHLLQVAEKEMAGENKKALKAKKHDMDAEALQDKIKKAAKKHAKTPAAKAHKPHTAAVKHALHKATPALPVKEDK